MPLTPACITPALSCTPFACPQDNESPIGVSLAFTVRAMDAGPVLDSESVLPVDSWQTPQMLEHLFSRGIQ